MNSVHRLILISFLLLMPFSFTAADESVSADTTDDKTSEEKEELISLTEERRETLKYGIDSEVITLIEKITEEEDAIYAEDVAKIYDQTTNSAIMDAAVDYFIKIDYGEAAESAAVRIENWEDESFNTLQASLRYYSAYPGEDAEDVIFQLVDHDTKTLASAALTALGKCGSEKSVDPLLDLLDDDDYYDELKPTIIRALGEIGSEQALDTLIDILDDVDEEKSWRWTACEALGKIGHVDALPVVKNALQDSDTYLRSYAVKALASFEGEDIEATLIQSLRDSFWRVRVSAAEALGEMQSSDAVDILIYKAKKDPENNVKLAAVKALGEIGDATAIEFLQELYKKSNTNQSVRTMAAQIIIEKDIKGSLEVITGVLNEEWEKDSSPVLSYTCQFLSKTEHSGLASLFEMMLNHKDVAIKIYGIRGIQLNGLKTMNERLEQLTDEKVNNAVRKAALGALEQLE
ncbi:MAG: HEAT repeat domain-containing protein [Spirochaetales bacterium]|uniref:HEAT repeat domain-containing protein n=1 Tax=Candidatus Thalassospirochaeta sargassi TaxID=3119039 RepID=A0AAJ1MJL1_9SPIO|nr:HEAT repeat domain-containing protein [Spirochaetales bacterium]